MHWLAVYCCALFLFLPLVPNGIAQAADPEAPLALDPAGDVTGRLVAGGDPQPVSGFEDVDVKAFWFREDPAEFHVKVQLAHMDGQPGPDQPATHTYFTFDGKEHRVYMGRSADNEAWFASISTREGTGNFRYLGPLRASYDTAEATVWTSLPRSLVTGASGAEPGRGNVLENVWTQAFAVAGYNTQFNEPTLGLYGPLLDVMDRAPDAAGLAVDVQFGGAQSAGDLTLTAARPYMASNGGPMTFVYDLEAHNAGESDRTLDLAAMHLPLEWNASLPGSQLSLPAGASATFQLALTTAGFHDHGASRSFHVRLSDPTDEDAWAEVELGVHYLDIAQPAGHHDTVYLHTHPWSATAGLVNPPLGGIEGVLSFNTLSEDPEDAGVPLHGQASVAGNEWYRWAGCLDPALALGLDFDLERTGQMRLPISTTKPVMGAVLSGRILLVPAGDELVYCAPYEYASLDVVELATIEASAATDLSPNGQHTFESVVRPLAAGDRVPYLEGAHLVLELRIDATVLGVGGTGGLVMEPGGNLQLPLSEYEDAVPAFQGVTAAGDGATFSEPTAAKAKESPGLGLGAAVVALALLAFGRRQA